MALSFCGGKPQAAQECSSNETDQAFAMGYDTGVAEGYYQGAKEGAKAFQEFLAEMLVRNCADKRNPAGTDILIRYGEKTYVLTCSVAELQSM